MRGHSAATAAGITAVPPETGIFRFVHRCGELTGTISLVPLSCPACSETVGGHSRTRWGDGADAHSFRGLRKAFRCARSRERQAAGQETRDGG
jgi:hypothetical protein